MRRSTPRWKRLRTLALAAATVSLVLTGCGATGELTVSDARSRMSPMLTGVGAVYLDITNATDTEDQLLAGTVDSSVAASVEVHETFDADEHGAGGQDGDEHEGMSEGDDAAMSGADDPHQDGADPTPEGFAMMGMREIEALTIPAGETIELLPGGYHLMLIDLADDLVPGEVFDLTLTFAEAGEVTVTVEVREDV